MANIMNTPAALLHPLQTLQNLTAPYDFLWSVEVFQHQNKTFLLSSNPSFHEQLAKYFRDIQKAQNISPYFWSSVCFSDEPNDRLLASTKEGLSFVQQELPYHVRLSVFCLENEASFYNFCSLNLNSLKDLSVELTGHVDKIDTEIF
jgi:hypothetical protein